MLTVKKLPYIITSRSKILGITLTKHIKNIYAKIQKIKDEIKDDLNKWRDTVVKD